jgi:hypothetical protein
MALRLVDDDREVSLNLPADPTALEAIGIQIQRCVTTGSQNAFELRLVQRLIELVDADLQPPTAKQLAYAISIARTLDIAVPGEAFRFRGSMTEFLGRFSDLHRAHQGGNGSHITLEQSE